MAKQKVSLEKQLASEVERLNQQQHVSNTAVAAAQAAQAELQTQIAHNEYASQTLKH